MLPRNHAQERRTSPGGPAGALHVAGRVPATRSWRPQPCQPRAGHFKSSIQAPIAPLQVTLGSRAVPQTRICYPLCPLSFPVSRGTQYSPPWGCTQAERQVKKSREKDHSHLGSAGQGSEDGGSGQESFFFTLPGFY